jgi:hypothetical protein
MNPSNYARVTLAGLALAGATLVGTTPAAMARPDPEPAERTRPTAARSGEPAQFRKADEDSMARTRNEPAPVDQADTSGWELGLAVTAGAAAAGGLVFVGRGRRTMRTRRSA